MEVKVSNIGGNTKPGSRCGTSFVEGRDPVPAPIYPPAERRRRDADFTGGIRAGTEFSQTVIKK